MMPQVITGASEPFPMISDGGVCDAMRCRCDTNTMNTMRTPVRPYRSKIACTPASALRLFSSLEVAGAGCFPGGPEAGMAATAVARNQAVAPGADHRRSKIKPNATTSSSSPPPNFYEVTAVATRRLVVVLTAKVGNQSRKKYRGPPVTDSARG